MSGFGSGYATSVHFLLSSSLSVMSVIRINRHHGNNCYTGQHKLSASSYINRVGLELDSDGLCYRSLGLRQVQKPRSACSTDQQVAVKHPDMQECASRGRKGGAASSINTDINNAGLKMLKKLGFSNVLCGKKCTQQTFGAARIRAEHFIDTESEGNFCSFAGELPGASSRWSEG